MRNPTSNLLAAALALAPATAFAHPGDHDGMTMIQAARHLLTEPDHQLELAVVAALMIALIGGWRLARRAKQP